MFESKKVLAKLRTKGKNKTIRESNTELSGKILRILIAINNNNIRNALVVKKNDVLFFKWHIPQ